MRRTHQVLICYDIVDNAKRERVAKFLVGHITRVQKSVFEGQIGSRQLEEIRRTIPTLIDLGCDSVRIYQLCSRCVVALDVLGTGEFVQPRADDVVI